MIRIDIWRAGAGYKVRLHEHEPGDGDQCCGECEHGPTYRAYPDRDARPPEEATLVRSTVLQALSVQGNHEFLRSLGRADTLFR